MRKDNERGPKRAYVQEDCAYPLFPYQAEKIMAFSKKDVIMMQNK